MPCHRTKSLCTKQYHQNEANKLAKQDPLLTLLYTHNSNSASLDIESLTCQPLSIHPHNTLAPSDTAIYILKITLKLYSVICHKSHSIHSSGYIIWPSTKHGQTHFGTCPTYSMLILHRCSNSDTDIWVTTINIKYSITICLLIVAFVTSAKTICVSTSYFVAPTNTSIIFKRIVIS
jgi:hypothetical protein